MLANAYDAFLDRLIEATRSLKVGPAVDPGTTVGPVIDEEAYERILEYIEIGKEESRPRPPVKREKEIARDGKRSRLLHPPAHLHRRGSPLAGSPRKKFSAPCSSVMKAEDLDEALEIANGTDYALTGGIFSRSPKHLQKAREEFVVGNLYLNRGITGALVERQPFGGFKMSGIGSKAGGPDYLLQFLIPINITENTMRRGFAPPPDEEK